MHFSWLVRELPVCCLLGPPGFNWCFSFAPELVIERLGISFVQLSESVESSFLIHDGIYHDLFVCP